jgi:hypothetical protein
MKDRIKKGKDKVGGNTVNISNMAMNNVGEV